MKNTVKRILAVALVIALCMGSALAAGFVEATGARVNVRSGPGENYSVLYELVEGESVSYLGVSSTDSRGNTWYKVQFYSYGTGWVCADYAKLTGDSGYRYVQAEDGDVYVRSAPSLNAKALTAIPEGSIASYMNQTSTDERGVVWYYVNYNGTIGWVSSRYAVLYGSSDSTGLPDFGATGGYVKAEGGDVYLRSVPGLSGDDLDTMFEGETATYLGQRSTDERGVVWYKVNFEGQIGWVSSRYSMLYGNSASLPDFNANSGYVKAEGGDCNVRTSPSLSGGSLGVLHEGETASYLGQRSTDDRGVIWYKVNFYGETGWVSSRYSTLYGGSSSSTLPDFTLSAGYVKAEGGDCNVRTQPNLNGGSLGVLHEGETAVYLGERSTDERGVVWYKVKFEGNNGWVSSRYAEII